MKFVFKYRASIALEPRAKDNEGKKIDFIHSIGFLKKGIYPIEGKIFNLTVKIRINNKAVQKDGVEIKTWFNNSTDLIKELFEKWPKIIPKEKPIIIVNIIVNKLMVKVVVAESKIISETLDNCEQVDTVTITNIQKTISFRIGADDFEIDLKRKRKKKE